MSINRAWRKSTYSMASGDCAEVRGDGDMILMRDSKDPAGPVLAFSRAEWAAFIADVKRDRRIGR